MASIATSVHAVDSEGYVFVSLAAACAIFTLETQIAIASSQITIASSTSPPVPFPQVSSSPANLADRLRILVKNVQNPSAQPPNRTAYVGGPGVTTQHGYPLQPGEELLLEVTDGIQLFATKDPDASGTIPLRTVELT